MLSILIDIVNMKPMSASLSASEAAARLGVTKATLYAYVSRGMIRSEPGDTGRRRYLAEDVDRLLAHRELRRNPGDAVREALHWGAPVLDSSLTLIQDGHVYYRGHDAVRLAAGRRLEDVASLLWLGSLDAAHVGGGAPATAPGAVDVGMLDAFQAALPAGGASDLAAHDLRPEAVARAGARILRLLTSIATDTAVPPGARIADHLSSTWTGSDSAARVLDQAMILCADHELNVSSFTVRCVASAGSTPYAAVAAGLAALQGGKHGGTVERVESLLRECEDLGAREAVTGRLRRGEPVPGFGHRLYPDGDPRGHALLRSALDARPDHPAAALARLVAAEVEAALGARPTIDFALAALARVLELPRGAGLGLFALGRTVGWVAHAIEEYEADRLIRPRARYVGPAPGEVRA
jgi:citrate synthase